MLETSASRVMTYIRSHNTTKPIIAANVASPRTTMAAVNMRDSPFVGMLLSPDAERHRECGGHCERQHRRRDDDHPHEQPECEDDGEQECAEDHVSSVGIAA